MPMRAPRYLLESSVVAHCGLWFATKKNASEQDLVYQKKTCLYIYMNTVILKYSPAILFSWIFIYVSYICINMDERFAGGAWKYSYLIAGRKMHSKTYGLVPRLILSPEI